MTMYETRIKNLSSRFNDELASKMASHNAQINKMRKNVKRFIKENNDMKLLIEDMSDDTTHPGLINAKEEKIQS